ncbi:MAG: MFS transporter [Spirochaetes bacterium]|nr:MFS transporter [Spirochaetota bacterium]
MKDPVSKEETARSLNGNIGKLYAFKTLQWFLVIIPVIVPFYQAAGLSMAQILGLQAAFSLSLAILEIPSGYLADLLGRRKSLVLGAVCATAGYALYCISDSFAGFLVAELIMGAGSSFVSGADSALFYDTLLSSGREGEFKRLEGRRGALGNFSESAASILGGLLAVVSLRLPVYVETAVVACSIPLAWSLVEPKSHGAGRARAGLTDLAKTVQYALHGHKELKWLLIYGAVMGASTLTMVWFVQPYFKLTGLPLGWYGVVWAGFNLSVGLFSLAAHRVEGRLGRRTILMLLLPLSATAYLVVGFFPSLWILPVFFTFYFVRGLGGPLLSAYMNPLIPSERRATILSVNALLVRVLFSIMGPLAGALSDRSSLPIALRVLGASFFHLGLPAIYLLTRKKTLAD